MQRMRSDRRSLDKKCHFPLLDCDGNQVTIERRSGKDRRKERQEEDVARNILNNLLH
ncbi:MAG: hypothetical protein GY694_03895 [Gammaproteobacteria bacterium]|nr:hypothetical protein [Gammaproteobacteria bacterium]